MNIESNVAPRQTISFHDEQSREVNYKNAIDYYLPEYQPESDLEEVDKKLKGRNYRRRVKTLIDNTIFVTTVKFPNYDPNSTSETDIEKVRGDLAIQTLKGALSAGMRVVVLENGSSEAYLKLLKENEIPFTQGEGSMGDGRRTAFKIAFELTRQRKSKQLILWCEPEKPDVVTKRSLQHLVAPFTENKDAMVTIMNRTREALSSWPEYQMGSEVLINHDMNNALEQAGLRDESDKKIDWLVAPKAFVANAITEEILCDDRYSIDVKGRNGNTVNLDLWPNSIVMPAGTLLRLEKKTGIRLVETSLVPCRYPASQKKAETNSNAMVEKRKDQAIAFRIAAGIIAAAAKGVESKTMKTSHNLSLPNHKDIVRKKRS